MIDKWYDVQDQDGVWRVGECFFQDKQGTKTIGFDGFHPNYTTTFCKHSTKILPIRTKTFGLTIPQDRRPLREVLTQMQLQNVSGRINLYLMKSNYLQFQPKLIKSSIRTQFLILVDKIVTTPFQIIREIKQLDPNITNFFINVLSIYTRVMQFSKTFMSLIETNQTARELYYSIYELTLMANIIFGMHLHSNKFYQHKLNISIKSSGFIDFFVLSDSGLMLFRNFFKGAHSIKKPNQFDYQVSQAVANLILDLCQKMKNYLVDGTYQSKTVLVLDQIINNLRHMCEQNQTLRLKISNNPLLISKIQSLYFKLRSNKACPLRKYISKEQAPHPQPKIELPLSLQKSTKEEEINKLEERVKKLESLVTSQQQQQQQQKGEEFRDAFKFERPELPIENLGEEMFLGSLEWTLEMGDIETAKKVVKWRKSLLQVGRITGWEVALAIGSRTFKKQQITAADIIQANYQYLTKQKKQ